MSAILMGAALNAAGASAGIVDPNTTVQDLASGGGSGGSDRGVVATIFQVRQALQGYLLRTLPNNIPTSRPSFHNVIIQQSGRVRTMPASLDSGANYAGHPTIRDHGDGRIETVASGRWGL